MSGSELQRAKDDAAEKMREKQRMGMSRSHFPESPPHQ